MKRLTHTSGGWVELDVDQIPIGGFSVRVAAFGEGGWASVEEAWNAKYAPDGKSLELFVAETAGIPVPEASELVRETLREWRERGGKDVESGEKRKMLSLAGSVFGLAGIGALAVLLVLILVVSKLV